MFSESKEIGPSRSELQREAQQLALQKQPKISINMEIKNLNIFGPPNLQTGEVKKKKLHKKTISALGKHQKEIRER